MVDKDKYTLLPAIKETTEEYERCEKHILKVFREEIYVPIMAEFVPDVRRVLNSFLDDLCHAIHQGRVQYNQGRFTTIGGKFNAKVSKALKQLGAKWERGTSSWRILSKDLPQEVKAAIGVSESKFSQTLERVDARIRKILPEEISGRVKVAKFFDRALFKVDKAFHKNVERLTVVTELTDSQRKTIARDWQNNMDLWIKDFLKKEIVELRANMQKTLFAGNRYESAVKTIQKSYGVSANKAKFLARQETNLLMAKFKETRYTDAGITEYIWGCVSGTKDHPVRPSHKILEGKKFSWNNPPITTAPSEPQRRNNPGQDYNCRCFARPIVKLK